MIGLALGARVNPQKVGHIVIGGARQHLSHAHTVLRVARVVVARVGATTVRMRLWRQCMRLWRGRVQLRRGDVLSDERDWWLGRASSRRGEGS